MGYFYSLASVAKGANGGTRQEESKKKRRDGKMAPEV
jgi:hypothetical protein